MKRLGLVVLTATALILAGCATFQRSEVIDTAQNDEYASGTYRDSSAGPTGIVRLAGSGVGWGGGGGNALGVIGIDLQTGPPPSGAYQFARAITMINYSKKLKSVKYDEFGGVIDYEFESKPVSASRTDIRRPAARPKPPSSFGHQPIE
jgi:hypothetical protein